MRERVALRKSFRADVQVDEQKVKAFHRCPSIVVLNIMHDKWTVPNGPKSPET